MKIKIGIVTLLIAGLMALTAGLVSAQEPFTVSGTVKDATTGEDIPGALVQVNGTDSVLEADTDVSGEYSIADVPVGQQSVTASADGYESETIGAEVSETEGAYVNFTLQPLYEGQEEQEGDDGDGKVAGSRKGYVGIFASATGGATGSGTNTGAFVVTTKKGDFEIQIPGEGLESITRRPGRSAGVPEEGDEVAVLVEFVDQGGDGLAQVARQVIVKPAPKKPVVGAVVSITTDEDGVRTLTIMRPNGTTKEVRLGPRGKPPEVGDLVTAFPGPDDGDDPQDGPPIARGLVRA
ncbi:MAG: carboxypeptidase regulatory-like domain-containing protein, partial [Chloroflexi bacterium]|nr:carboxypeptidase regulatory-like domain-containing protein [Chloroflexota bacterium]